MSAPAPHSATGQIAGKEASGTATGVSLVFTSVGTISGPPLFGYLVDQSGSYAVAWLALALAAGLATWQVVARIREGAPSARAQA